jgi:Flp pilus assembly protein TadD
MGFLGGIFQKKQQLSPLDALREKVDANPKDARLAQDLATQLKAAGLTASAIEYARRAAVAHREAGFLQKALAVLRSAQGWGTPTPELLQDLCDVLLELKHKEDARGTLMKLRQLHATAGNRDQLTRIDAQLAELGPGR